VGELSNFRIYCLRAPSEQDAFAATMSASKLKQTSINPSSKESSSSSAYTAYNAVDELVAKPVFGSDGAKKWQSFAQATQKQHHVQSNSVAPTAPLKAIDRATGFTSWKEEREYSNQIRQSDDQTKNTTSSVYTNFTQKASHNNIDMSSKERKRIERRIIGENQEYFIPSPTFAGWKFDYIFTTRMETHGTGYYFDGTDSLKLLNGLISNDDIPSSARVLSIASSDSVDAAKKRSAPASGENTDEASAVNANAHASKKKKKTKNLAPIIVNNPNHPLEQIAAILAQRQPQSSSELLPMGWECAKDGTTGKTYYFNRTTGERTWEPPQSVPTVPISATNNNSTNNNDAKSLGWNVAKDPTSGKEYYYNTQTGETSWEKPTTSSMTA
jgi:WW domain